MNAPPVVISSAPSSHDAPVAATSHVAEDVRTTECGLEEQLALQQHESMLLYTLARQLEYYFSPHNLSKDTYLQTLRTLNDGCVPVTILANFGKVRTILGSASLWAKPKAETEVHDEDSRMNAILQAVHECYTDRLQLYAIDTVTGKIATDNSSGVSTIWAVGQRRTNETREPMVPTTDEPLDARTHEVVDPCHVSAPVDNTIILRDVDPIVSLDEVQSLLNDIEECPPVLGIVSDVANSWFIALDTTDRSELMRVMMQLRSQTFPSTGDYVMARVRASMVAHSTVDVYSTLPTVNGPLSSTVLHDGQVLPKKKKKKKRSKKRNKKSSSNSSLASSSMAMTATTDASSSTASTPTSRPPTLTDFDFPSLLLENGGTKKVEWVTTQDEDDSLDDDEEDATSASDDGIKPEDDEDDEDRKSFKALVSDGASTTTTTSSSNASSNHTDPTMISKPHVVLGGYAAALLKAPKSLPSNATTRSEPSTVSPNGMEVKSQERMVSPDSIAAIPLTWRGNPSFASILSTRPSQ